MLNLDSLGTSKTSLSPKHVQQCSIQCSPNIIMCHLSRRTLNIKRVVFCRARSMRPMHARRDVLVLFNAHNIINVSIYIE
jgi:hypothetical protein